MVLLFSRQVEREAGGAACDPSQPTRAAGPRARG